MKTVWITGASSGIGEACAYEYARQGSALILTSSSEERLAPVAERCRELGAGDVEVLPYDLSLPDGIQSLVFDAWDFKGRIDTLICNAGISQRATVGQTSPEMLRRIMEVDFFAPALMAAAILPLMIGAGGGSIAVTTSIAGYFGFPLRCAYSSAKHALYGYFETLRAEYGSRGIRVTLICPGRVRTGISLKALGPGGIPHAQMDPGQAGGIRAAAAAHRIVRAVSRGRREVFVGGAELLMVWIKRFFPGLCARLVRRVRPE